ncbi:MAG: epoxyqueuosine reductase QueH [Anaerostipes sp.]|nr:epoxyqueuosine reductase QueH [Anaerostipes sp.]MDD3745214.1 epoxyqueuosine reductase QueH [Anaerostipes sp.]
MKENYQKKLDTIIENLNKERPTLLLHSCCAPCSSYVLEYLSQYFKITILYYNPNISSEEEFQKRAGEEQRLIKDMELDDVECIVAPYHPDEFYDISKGYEDEPEKGARCYRCYRLRLEATAKKAKELGSDYFTTTLSISPLKNAQWLNDIGLELEKEYEVPYLVSDFKKKGGYQRSIQLSKEYDLYRQNFCGCIYSKNS